MNKYPITAVILAGGQGSRMGGKDKGLMPLKGKFLYQHLLECLAGQAEYLAINANRHLSLYEQSGVDVFPDIIQGYLGPLSGIYSGLCYANTEWVLYVSCDTPFIPDCLLDQLWKNKGNHLAAYVNDGEKNHPTLLLIHRSLKEPLKHYLDIGNRKLMLFLAEQDAVAVDFSDSMDNFVNINTDEELNYWNNQ